MKPTGTITALRSAATVAVLGISFAAFAQDGYKYTQDSSSTAQTTSNSGPVRLARISYIVGNVEWRPGGQVDWSNASQNIPLRQGAQVWVNSAGKAELQFDDGSRLRLGAGTIATLQTMYSDHSGEFTEVKLNSGLASFTLINKDSVYQVDTPLTSIKAQGPCQLRVGVGNDVEVAVRRGKAQIEGSQGSAPLRFGQYAHIANQTSPYEVRDVPSNDNWDNFSDNRDNIYDHPSQYVPSNIGLVSGDMNNYGDWRPDNHYGHVWYPRVHNAGWRPYHDGHWVWVDPFGWTWVASEPWGWAPYHYGSWIHASYGWGWAPGPRHQYWSPAVVHFSTDNGLVAWVPLGPSEIYYPPALSIGFSSGDWSLSFSIGGAGSYYPSNGNYCEARPWDNQYINERANSYDPNRSMNIYNNNTYITNNNFVPMYGGSAYAITRTTISGFGGRGQYLSGTNSDTQIFRRGHGFAAPRGQSPVFGPASVRPTRTAFTPSRTFSTSRPSSAILQRSVFRSRLPVAITRTSIQGGRFSIPSTRSAVMNRAPSNSRNRINNGGSFGAPRNTTAGRPARMTNAGAANNAARARNAGTANNAVRAWNAGAANNAAKARNTGAANNAARVWNAGAANNAARARNAGANNAARARNGGAANNAARARNVGANNAARARNVGSATNTARARNTGANNAARARNGGSANNAARARNNGANNAARVRNAPRQGRSTPQQRSAPQQWRSAPSHQQRSAPQQRRSSPPQQQRSAPQQWRSAPPHQQRSAPQLRRSSPPQQPRNAPQQRRSAPPQQQRSAPQQRRSSPPQQQQRSAPPRNNDQRKGHGGG